MTEPFVLAPGKGRVRDFTRVPDAVGLPHLLEVQQESYRRLIEQGLAELLAEFSPIQDPGGKLDLYFEAISLSEPTSTPADCRQRDGTYSAPLRLDCRLVNRETGEISVQNGLFAGDFPLMTEAGTFIINGTERVAVSQLVRSPGLYYGLAEDLHSGRRLGSCLLIPTHGAWLEFETGAGGVLGVKIDRKKKLPATVLLRAFGLSSREAIEAAFADVDLGDTRYVQATLEKDPTDSTEHALVEFYRKMRPGDPPSVEAGRSLFATTFEHPRHYNLGRVGRYKLDKRLGRPTCSGPNVLTLDDLVQILRRLVLLNRGEERPDDIDHLGNRRVRTVGELLFQQLRIGMLRMEKVVKQRMTLLQPAEATPAAVLSTRPLITAVREFFNGSQLSQFLDQTNPLAELSHKRRLSALGPGGLNRERAGVDVRDVHHSHYGRICPIESPEGPNIGLISQLGSYARVNEYGFLETPYRPVVSRLSSHDPRLVGRLLRGDCVVEGETLARDADEVTPALAARLSALPEREVAIRPYVEDRVVYLAADDEERYSIAQAVSRLDAQGNFLDERVGCRVHGHFATDYSHRMDYIEVSPKQIVSVGAALIPFLQHDDANRALMGANMQRQAVPLQRPEVALIGTGLEERVARDSGQVILARRPGLVRQVAGAEIVVETPDGEEDRYRLRKFERSNQGTWIHHRAVVHCGQRVAAGEVLADGASTAGGTLALGRNLLVAFMPLYGHNYEDAMVVSERLVKEDVLTSIHLERYECYARQTRLGPEEITRDLPNVGEEALKDLDENGIVRVGAFVKPGDILVGKVTPKVETDLSAEEKLLRALFGEKVRDVKDSSLRVPHGERGTVVAVQVFDRNNHDQLPARCEKLVRVTVAQTRKVTVGDKLAGRHGNKGVVAQVLPEEDMPMLPDGTPVDICLNPIGVPSRMNVGQILETHLGWAARKLNVAVSTPVFDGATEDDVRAMLREAGLPDDGKVLLRDGRSGEVFDHPVTVGYMYMLKLFHLVEDKVHARSTGPYSLITQQPLGGKAQFGGQRFGEMEVWALEAYGASHVLQELLTVKSDDIEGRAKLFEALIKGETPPAPGVPESFKVLVKELQSLGLDFEALGDEEGQLSLEAVEDVGPLPPVE